MPPPTCPARPRSSAPPTHTGKEHLLGIELGVAHLAPGEGEEHILQGWTPHSNRKQALRKLTDEVGQKGLPGGDLEAYLSVLDDRFDVIALADLLGGCHVVRGREGDEVTTDGVLQSVWRVEGDDAAVIDDRDPPTILGLVHVVGGHEDRQVLAPAKIMKVGPDVLPCLWIKPQRRFVEKQDARVMQEPARDLEPALHATRERAHAAFAPVPQLHHGEQFTDTRFSYISRDSVVVAVRAQVLLG